MADASKTEQKSASAPLPVPTQGVEGTNDTRPMTDLERQNAIVIEQLRATVRALENEVQAYKDLEAEQAAAQAKARADKKTASHPAALLSVMGEGRRLVSKGARLTEKEIVGLELGVHYEMVEG